MDTHSLTSCGGQRDLSEDKIYIILVNWNGRRDILECLESILRLNYSNYQVIICDNSSEDGSVEAIKAWAQGSIPEFHAQNPELDYLVFPNTRKPVDLRVLSRGDLDYDSLKMPTAPIIVIETGENLGFAGGNNIGMRFALRAADAKYFWLLNTDTVVDPMALSALVERAKAIKDRGLVGSMLVYYHQIQKLQAAGVGRYSKWKALSSPIGSSLAWKQGGAIDLAPVEAAAEFVIGASMLVPATFVKRVGLMSEEYFLYFEELDWAVRAQPLGYKSFVSSESIVYHKVGGSTPVDRKDRISTGCYFSYVNRLRFTAKYFRNQLMVVRLRLGLEALRSLIDGRPQVARLSLALAIRGKPPEGRNYGN